MNFEKEVRERIDANGQNEEMKSCAHNFMNASSVSKYTYNFSWLGRPIIQYPQDIIAMQELIWAVKPDLIIETGIAHGGSLILSASMITLLEASKAIKRGKVLGIDIDIRAHNRVEIEKHPLSEKIEMLQGSSIDKNIVKQVHDFAQNYNNILVCLDSNHTHAHVLAELNAYGPLVSKGSYCVVFDTVIEDLNDNLFADRPWGNGNNPKTAVWEYLKSHPEFEIDKNIENKLLITVAPDGYLKKTK
ncbi:MAG: cephalosporin hydroxylase family protein [Thermoplasmata archaeon]|nr:cephalosporin hydroxylase family protein [Thermoplasmata archaeon]